MDYIKQLEKLLKEDVLAEVEENILEINSMLEKKRSNKQLKDDLAYMKEVKKYFTEVVDDINNKSITQEQALDILEGLEDMKVENQEI